MLRAEGGGSTQTCSLLEECKVLGNDSVSYELSCCEEKRDSDACSGCEIAEMQRFRCSTLRRLQMKVINSSCTRML